MRRFKVILLMLMLVSVLTMEAGVVINVPAVAELKVRRVSDADGVTVITLHDALGREVIRRAPGEGGTMADTYTVSDAWGNPLLVLQPMGSKYLADGDVWNSAHPMIEGYAFIYRYDRKLRQVSGKVPGCVAELTAYDTQGRVAYTRGGDLAAFGRKRFYLYDEYSRPAASGICEDFLSEAEWGEEHPAQTLRRGALQGATAADYDWNGVTMPTAAQITEVSYYDRYLPGTKPTVGVAAPLGMPTGERTAVMAYGLPGDSTVEVWHAYNALGQEIQTDEKRPGGDRVLRSATYTIGGLPLQNNVAVSGKGKYHALNVSTEYDAFGRVTQSRAVTNLGATVVLERNTYDAAGRLAMTETNGGMTASFGYDARGALTARKDSLMEMEYTYATGSAPSYAGRISGRKTRVRDGIGFDVTNHSYTYDAMGRLAEVTLKQGQSVIGTLPSFPSLGAVTLAADSLTLGDIYPLNPVRPTLSFPADNSESFTYDLNANLLTISRKGKDDTGSYRVVDEIEMGYIGNQLSWLRDTAEDPLLEGSMDIPQGNYSGYDIMYDGAGRVTRDVSRGISHVNYNVTGTPFVVGTMTADCAVYGYTSSGAKLSETIYNGSVTTRRDYVGPCEYVDGKLERINVPQGYIDSLGVLHAYIHDIQGNVAGVYEAKAGKKQLEQLNEYYAYGGLTADSKGQDRNRYKHTGKELVSDLGINSYDFTARWQYPMAGAFTSPDALAYRKPWNSPYSFCGGDPINGSDPTGNDYNIKFDKENKTVTVSAKYFAYEGDVKTATEAVSFWNGQSNIFSFEYQGESYSVVFDLSIEVVSEEVYLNRLEGHPGIDSDGQENLRNNVLRNEMNKYSLGTGDREDKGVNTFMTTENTTAFEGRGMSKDNSGGTIGGKQVLVASEFKDKKYGTGMYEIGHTLGLDHSRSGIMSPSLMDWSRTQRIYKGDTNKIIKNAIKGIIPMYNGIRAGQGFIINSK